MVTPVFKFILSGSLIIAIVWLLFGPVHIESLWWREAFNSGHTILFLILSLLIYRQISYRHESSQTGSGWKSNVFVNVFIICLLLNISIELLQVQFHREMSVDDVYRGMLGTMAGISLSAMIEMRGGGQKKVIPVFLMSGVLFLVAGSASLMRLSLHYAERSNAFPVVVDFNSAWSESFVLHQDGAYPGVHIIEPEPSWLGYDSLSIEVYSRNNNTVRAGFRVHDKAHNNEHDDRFNSILTVRPGYNVFEVPLDAIKNGPVERVLDLASVSGLILFATRSGEWDQIEVSNLTLK